jgi:hypothetical protein
MGPIATDILPEDGPPAELQKWFGSQVKVNRVGQGLSELFSDEAKPASRQLAYARYVRG